MTHAFPTRRSADLVGNRPLRAYANVLAVNDAATWLGQGVMFLLLGVLVGPRSLLDVLWPALEIAAFLMLVARPLAVTLCLAPFRYRAREIGFISWVGLGGDRKSTRLNSST